MSLIILHKDGTVEPAIRKLTQDEQNTFSRAVLQAVGICSAWRDAIALLRPFYDATCETAYVDKHARMGLGAWFFSLTDIDQAASVILHEASHVLYNHFIRGESMAADAYTQNIAGDFEINTGLEGLEKVDLNFAVFPDRKPYTFPRHKTLEQYVHYLLNDPKHKEDMKDRKKKGGGQGQGAPSPGAGKGQTAKAGEAQSSPSGKSDPNGDPSDSGGGGDKDEKASGAQKGHSHNGVVCDQNTDEREEAADEAGIEKASVSEQQIAKKNTAIRTAEAAEAARQAGDGALANFFDYARKNMQPPKVNWRNILRKILASNVDAIVKGKSDYSYKRTSRRLSDSKFIFPGMVTYQPKLMMGVDTSGSMSEEDHRRAIREIEGIIKSVNRNKDSLRIFSVDTEVKNCRPVSDVNKLRLQGGGGTQMGVGVDYCRTLPKKEIPDLYICATDGFVPWDLYADAIRKASRLFSVVTLVTTEGGYESVTDEVKKLSVVIDISEGREK